MIYSDSGHKFVMCYFLWFLNQALLWKIFNHTNSSYHWDWINYSKLSALNLSPQIVFTTWGVQLWTPRESKSQRGRRERTFYLELGVRGLGAAGRAQHPRPDAGLREVFAVLAVKEHPDEVFAEGEDGGHVHPPISVRRHRGGAGETLNLFRFPQTANWWREMDWAP